MLVLTRQLGEEIIIDGNIRVGIVKIARNKVQLSIQTPEGIRILRQELLLRDLEPTQPRSVAVSQ
jgi:carbon storage regulator CsrA